MHQTVVALSKDTFVLLSSLEVNIANLSYKLEEMNTLKETSHWKVCTLIRNLDNRVVLWDDMIEDHFNNEW